MSFETTLRRSLTAAADGMPLNPDRARQVAHGASRATRWRTAGAAAGVVAAASVVVVVGIGVASGPSTVAPATAPSSAAASRLAFDRVRAIPGGLRVEFVGADPSLPSTNPCSRSYSVRSEPEASGVLRVTLTSDRRAQPASSGTDICHGIGFPRSIDIATSHTYSVVVDTTSGIRHDVAR